MAFATPPVAALLEIGRETDGSLPGQLITAAYRASRSQPVMLVLDEVTPREVDAVLDSMVASTYRDHRGVIYARSGDDQEVLAVAASASRVFARSAQLRAKLSSWGIPYEDTSRAAVRLDQEPG